MTLAEHWENIYSSRPVQMLGWYEKRPDPSLRLLRRCSLRPEDPILDIGSGASTLIDHLIEERFQRIVAVDISASALEKLKARLGEDKAKQVTWIVDDVTRPTRLDQIHEMALWHDRALLHFLVEEEARQTYRRTLLETVRPGGFVIIAAFSLQGAKQCSGLAVRNYDQNLIADFLGSGFFLKEWFDYLYTMPSGDLRPYIYTLFQKE